MKPDLYTKIILTVIAVMLSVIALARVTQPLTAHAADGPPDLKFSSPTEGTFYIYDQSKDTVDTFNAYGQHLGTAKLKY